MPRSQSRLSDERFGLAAHPLQPAWLLHMPVLALVYFVAAKASLLLAIPPGFASAVWPPSGIALAALLLYGLRLWPGIWIGAFLANATSGASWLPAMAIASGNTLEACAGLWLVQRWVGAHCEFRRPEAVFRFALATAASGLIAASAGTVALYAAGLLQPAELLINWYTWWQGDLAGMILLTPCALAWWRPPAPDAQPWPAAGWMEVAAFAAALLATFAIVGALADANPGPARTLFFLLIPFVAWAGCRFDARILTATVLALTATTLWLSLSRGPLMLAGSAAERLLVLQAFVATIALMGLALNALSRQRRDAEARLRAASDVLEAAVSARTLELAQKNRELAAELAERSRRSALQEAQHEIAATLVRATDWPEAIRESMRVVCERLDWALGQMWRVDAEQDLIHLLHVWSRPGFGSFTEASKAFAFGRGQGLPGSVWQHGAGQWVEDFARESSRPRVRWAAECRLHAAMCFPLYASGRVLGAIEFFASEARPEQPEMLQAMEAVGRQLGEYVVRSEAEALLRESEERLRLLIEGVKEYAIVMLDAQGRVATWNSGAARISGYTSAEILGQSFARFHSQEERSRKRPETLLRSALQRGSIQDEGWRVRKDHSRFWANEILTALHGSDGALRGFAVVMRDMTEHKQVEALEEAGRQTRQFLALLGHELRNPLAPIRNAVSVMRMREIADPHVKYCRDLIERQVQHLARLVDDLLDASRITTGVIGLQQEQLDLREAIELALEATEPEMTSRGHRLRFERCEEPLPVSGDRTRLLQLLQNVLGNAAKYTPNGGNIELRARRERSVAVVEVRDDGIGIAPELLPRIFDLFMQGDGSLARTEGGLGVGLALARRIAELHGGSIEAFSEGVGQGATFVLRLPLLDPTEGSSPVPSADASEERAPIPYTVLVVDDNRDAADSMATLLEMRGHQVLVAYEGYSALQAAAQHAPEVVLLDIGLPGMDGYQVAERLRAMEATCKSLIIALTGYGQAEDRNRSAQAHLDAHLVKPVDYRALCSAIERATLRAQR